MKQTQAIGIICLDFCWRKQGNQVWKSLSVLEFFVFSGHRERLLLETNISSANLCDQPHESAHHTLRSIFTNNGSTDAMQRTGKMFMVTVLKSLFEPEEVFSKKHKKHKRSVLNETDEETKFLMNFIVQHGNLPNHYFAN